MVSIKVIALSVFAAGGVFSQAQGHEHHEIEQYEKVQPYVEEYLNKTLNEWSEGEKALGNFLSGWSEKSVSSDKFKNYLSSLSQQVDGSNSALWRVSEACCGCCGGGDGDSTGPAGGGSSSSTAAGGGGGSIPPAVGNLFPMGLKGPFNQVGRLIGLSMRGYMNQLTINANRLATSISGNRQNFNDQNSLQTRSALHSMQTLQRNTNQVGDLYVERYQLSQAIDRLTEAVDNVRTQPEEKKH